MKIRWTTTALRDFTNICNYTEEQKGPLTARRAALQMYEAIDLLGPFPHRGRPGRKQGTREPIFRGLPFLAIYRLREEVVEVIRILHGAQKWP